jgi:hypothetical protein
MTTQTIVQLVVASGIIGGVIGGFIGSYATHRFTLGRERKRRVSEFRSFIAQFRSEAADRHHPPEDPFATFYKNKVPNLRHAAAEVADDFPPERRAQFDKLVSTAAGFTGAQADREEGEQRVTASLDAILQFLDSAK